jgi:hypothetical protein
VAKPCYHPEFICIDSLPAAVNFFNNSSVKKALGTEHRMWVPLNMHLAMDFEESGATTQSVLPAVIRLLDTAKMPIMAMNGDLDSLV